MVEELGVRLIRDPRRFLAAWLVLAGPMMTGADSPEGKAPTQPVAGSIASGSLPEAPPRPVANNSRCFVCHANYDFNEEPLVFGHAKANIGCIQCHGESTRHSADEDGLTPPDRMFPKAHIRFNCLGCHDWVKLVASDKTKLDRADLPEKPDHQAVLEATAQKKLCTDCHGDHRLGHRTRVWDKRTGALLRRDATPAMLRTSPGSK
jgi:hypothetical protein